MDLNVRQRREFERKESAGKRDTRDRVRQRRRADVNERDIIFGRIGETKVRYKRKEETGQKPKSRGREVRQRGAGEAYNIREEKDKKGATKVRRRATSAVEANGTEAEVRKRWQRKLGTTAGH